MHTSTFLLFLSSIISLKLVGAKETIILHNFLQFWQLLKEKCITKCEKVSISILALSSLYKCWYPFWGQFSQIFKTKVLIQILISQCIASINSKPDHPPKWPLWDSHILVTLGSGFRSSVLPGGLPPGLNQSKSWTILEKVWCFLKQMSSSYFLMFIYTRSEQCDFGPIYTITNTQYFRIYPGNLKSIPVRISPDQGR